MIKALFTNSNECKALVYPKHMVGETRHGQGFIQTFNHIRSINLPQICGPRNQTCLTFYLTLK